MFSPRHFKPDADFLINGETLTFNGTTLAQLNSARDALVNSDNYIRMATFTIPFETGWDGVKMRQGGITIAAIAGILRGTNDNHSRLGELTIKDKCLTVVELNELCESIPERTTLKKLTLSSLVATSQEDLDLFAGLLKQLSDKGITLNANPDFEPTFGTTYH